ncbi:hypothetical protein [Beggiatoa leptomitoformis]|uniref:Uncharacterized protein n=1 Tax=Beggiatoa leptomitoformis TaxID=288004 RepID=A0A2N9YJM8_9GAMM|nr:hypothetical protein [Beggiatoa leptomitoformis]ALG69398.2 hypothetical protein AL038_08145 [Beggiatoa leptomitoformis]AUI70673.2 hypothetical protein BLE401_16160 [Beggiatoa leptomitoformis]
MTHKKHSAVLSIAGILLFSMICLSTIHGLTGFVSPLGAGICAWLAGILLFKRVSRQQKYQVWIILTIGFICMFFSLSQGKTAVLVAAVSINQAVLAMLAAVGFLRLVTQPRLHKHETLPTGKAALLRTLYGVHLFGFFINMSVLVIMGDRLAAHQTGLSRQQAIILSRAFAMAVLWSPFFAAMAVIYLYIPHINFLLLMAMGLPLALCGLWLTGHELVSEAESQHFVGYPMHFASLWVPSLLAVCVVLVHFLFPQLPVLTLITLLPIVLVVIVLSLQQGLPATFHQIFMHITHNLPTMSGELLLFLAAGVMAAGISSVLQITMIQLPLSHFGLLEATLLLFVILLIALIGVHPLISITTLSSLFLPIPHDPNLLGMTFLMGWGLGVSGTPFSAMHLMMQGRFHLSSYLITRWNIRFTLKMIALSLVVLYCYDLVSYYFI